MDLSKSWGGAGKVQPLDRMVSGALTRIREALKRRGSTAVCELVKVFKEADTDGSGQLDTQEFRQLLAQCRIMIREDELRALMKAFDTSGDGLISMDEFIVGIRGQLNDRRRAVVQQMFIRVDANGNGVIEMDDLLGHYNATGHPDVIARRKTPEEVMRAFLSTFDKGDLPDGRVTYEEFEDYYAEVSATVDDDAMFQLMIERDWTLDQRSTVRDASQVGREAVVEPPQSVQKIMDKIRDALKQRGVTEIADIGRAFRIADDDGSGGLDKDEFGKFLRERRVPLNSAELDSIMYFFDVNHDGRISYDEFLTALRGQLSEVRLAAVEAAFAKVDANGNGQVEVEDLLPHFNATRNPSVLKGQKTAAEAISDFLSNFDSIDKDGVITKEEWIKYYASISASIDNDRYFVEMINNAWSAQPMVPKGTLVDLPRSGAATTSTRTTVVTVAGPSAQRAQLTMTNGGRTQAVGAGPIALPTGALSRSKRPRPSDTVRGIIERIRQKMKERGVTGIRDLGRAFRIADDDKSGRLTQVELRKFLSERGVDLSDRDLTALVNCFDTNGDRELSYDEFVVALRDDMNERRKKAVRDAFEVIDVNHNGVLELDDLRSVYNARGHPAVLRGTKTEDEVLRELLDSIDDVPDGQVTLDEFMAYYSDISASVDNDDYFCQLVDRAWKKGPQGGGFSFETTGAAVDPQDYKGWAPGPYKTLQDSWNSTLQNSTARKGGR